jgi:hypothetical protein
MTEQKEQMRNSREMGQRSAVVITSQARALLAQTFAAHTNHQFDKGSSALYVTP